jgi:formylglycine-generating enzyme required for sulfatase activity
MSPQQSSDPQAKHDVPSKPVETRPLVSQPTTDWHPSASDQDLSVLQPGARPLPEYELVRKLGEGGFGEVWHARGPGGLDAALKFIKLDGCGSALELRALELMKCIRHPNLVSLFGAWHKDKLLILAMELCDRTLHDRLKEALTQNLPGIPSEELLNYMRGAAEGLEALHEHNVQHRDIKPGNLLLLHKGVKVADFGLAKVMDLSVASHTGAMTVAYAPPEFFKGTITKHSDQYSLAATYFQLRTGRMLFTGSYHQVIHAHLHAEPDLSSLPAAEREVVARALSKEPEKRWPNCQAFVNELVTAYNPAPEKSTPPLAPCQDHCSKPQTDLFNQPTGLAAPSPRENDGPARQPAKPDKKRRWLPLVLGGGFVLLCLGGGVGLWALGGGPLTVGPSPSTKEPDKNKPPPPFQPDEQPHVVTVDLAGGVAMEFVLIPKGTFQMGSPPEEKERNSWEKKFDAEKQHDVEITKPFYLGTYPVTQEQYQALMKDNPSAFQEGKRDAANVTGLDTRQFPVEGVSWNDAQAFCRKMREADRQGRPFRLPTEAEWEYACRAGTTTPFYFGSVLNGKEANCNGNKPYGTEDKGANKERTTKVGEYGKNQWGLSDMHGNVNQWCEDYYGPYNDDLTFTDPLRAVKYSGDRRVLRGGTWMNDAKYCRAASRLSNAPGYQYMTGFRVAFRPD